jgi:bis(5'-nucleosyl)-tetraphosphatase (symmetrical)
MMLFAIGDLQGCARQLDLLIERVLSLSSDARFIFVGDLVNRGPDSLASELNLF